MMKKKAAPRISGGETWRRCKGAKETHGGGEGKGSESDSPSASEGRTESCKRCTCNQIGKDPVIKV